MKETHLYRIQKRALSRVAKPAMGLWLLCCAIPLTGCANARPVIDCAIDLPTGLTTCKAPQPYPDPATATQADAAVALVDTEAAWEDCAGKLKKIPGVLAACGAKNNSVRR